MDILKEINCIHNCARIAQMAMQAEDYETVARSLEDIARSIREIGRIKKKEETKERIRSLVEKLQKDGVNVEVVLRNE